MPRLAATTATTAAHIQRYANMTSTRSACHHQKGIHRFNSWPYASSPIASAAATSAMSTAHGCIHALRLHLSLALVV